jgi:hypothetical protein
MVRGDASPGGGLGLGAKLGEALVVSALVETADRYPSHEYLGADSHTVDCGLATHLVAVGV